MTPNGKLTEAERTILEKVRSTCVQILRAKNCHRRWQVYMFKAHKVYFALLTIIGGAGASQLVSEDGRIAVGNTTGILGMGAIVLAFALELYKTFGIEETAVKAMAAADASGRFEEDLRHLLEFKDPMQDLLSLWEKARGLASTFLPVMRGYDEVTEDAHALGQRLFDAARGNWDLPTDTETERSER